MLANSYLSPWLPYIGAVLAMTSLSLSAVYAVTRRWSISRVILVYRWEHRVHWEHVKGALIVLALIIVMALVTLGLALLV
jgi:hypothetical protein